MSNVSKKKLFVSGIVLSVALVHIFNPLRPVNGIWHDLYFSYFSDLILPFTFYFLLCVSGLRINIFRCWWVKAGSLFALVLAAEVLQYFGFWAFGTVYDPLDILMFATGIGLAVICDLLIFPKLFPFWED